MTSPTTFFTNQLRFITETNTRLVRRINDLELTIAQQSARISVLETPPTAIAAAPATTQHELPTTADSPPPSPPAKRPKTSLNRTFDIRVDGRTIIADDDSTVPASVITTPVLPSPVRTAPVCLQHYVNCKVHVHANRSDHHGNSFLVTRVTPLYLVCNTYPYADAARNIYLHPKTVTIVPHDHPHFTLSTSDSDSTEPCPSPTQQETVSQRDTTRPL